MFEIMHITCIDRDNLIFSKTEEIFSLSFSLRVHLCVFMMLGGGLYLSLLFTEDTQSETNAKEIICQNC